MIQRVLSTQPMPDALAGAVIALGNFDGFHQGHQAVAGRAIAMARARGVPAIIATFDPHPVRHFAPDVPPFRLTTLDQRQCLFAAAGADAMLVIEFDARVASLSAEDFIAMIAGHFRASGVVSGADFVFGRGRGGSAQMLSDAAQAGRFDYAMVAPVEGAGDVISSSRIRDALRAGDCAAAAGLLTRPFSIEGVVEHGDKVGRTLGFPTANIALSDYLRPRYGVYAVTGRLGDGRILHGAANIGIRPQFDPPKELLEPHFFDFDGDLYGQSIEVSFHAFLRGEARFDSIDALTIAMQRDCAMARDILSAQTL